MPTLADHPQIISLARSLGLRDGDSVEGIKRYCVERVKELVGDDISGKSIEDIERIVCEKLNITIIEVWSEPEVDRVIEVYAKRRKDPIFARLREELPADTFATLIKRKNQPGEVGSHYVAVIDCRGEKSLRRFFTRWHEIAHVLTMVKQWELPFHRSAVVKDPLESMMDIIAGEVGFLEPIFAPLVARQFRDGRLKLAGVAKIRSGFCESASFQATLNACAKFMPAPVIILEARPGFSKVEMNQREFPKPGSTPPVEKLRVTSSKRNEPAYRTGFLVPERMRVPKQSIIYRVFEGHGGRDGLAARENLNVWTCSRGNALPDRDVWVEAKRIPGGIVATISLMQGR